MVSSKHYSPVTRCDTVGVVCVQDAAVRKWTDEYMMRRFSEKRGVDKSVDNHFMYYAHRLAHNDVWIRRVVLLLLALHEWGL